VGSEMCIRDRQNQTINRIEFEIPVALPIIIK
jgi:hypothetical protein